jgi:hypothetical protein
MKKTFILIVTVALLMSSCGSYTATGAYVGGEFGHVIGSAIGGITNGRRGHDMGAIIGTVGGVVAGAAIGAAIDNAQERKYEERNEQRAFDRTHDYSGYNDNTAYDDRITFDNTSDADQTLGSAPSYSVEELSRRPPIEIRNASIYDADHNGVLTRGEECTVKFEIMNNTPHVVYDIFPLVEDVTANKHVKVSPNLRVESISPGQGIRYTATILADRKLKDGEIVVSVGVAQRDRRIDSQTRRFTILTRKNK